MRTHFDSPDYELRLAQFAQWLSTDTGAMLFRQEQAYFAAQVADRFGFFALQIEAGEYDLLSTNRIPWKGRCGIGPHMHVRADPMFMPFASQSVDLVVLPHVLDFHAHPHRVLREVERVLMPEGRVVLTGFNPYSLWGGMRWVKGRKGLPWSANFISLPRVQDWMELLSLDVVSSKMLVPLPPLAPTGAPHMLRGLDRLFARRFSQGGSVYCIEAVKKVRSLRLITPRWGSVTPVSASRKIEPARQVMSVEVNSAALLETKESP